MNRSNTRRRLAVAALLATAAFGSAAPAQANVADCDARYERLIAKFDEIVEKRGYEAAVEWWPANWERYWERCLRP
jgi:hypothetical protein